MTKNTPHTKDSCSATKGSIPKKTATGIDYSSPRKITGLSVFSPLTGRRKL